MQPANVSPPRSPSQTSIVSDIPAGIQRTDAVGRPADIEMGVVQNQAAPTQAEDRELVQYQRSYEHWVKGAIGLGMTGMSIWMFKMAAFPDGKSIVDELGDPDAHRDALKHDMVDSVMAMAGGTLALYDAYCVYRRDRAARQAAHAAAHRD